MKFEREFACTYSGVVHADERSFPHPVGPNMFGEMFVPKSATYDAEADKTRVVFALHRRVVAPHSG